MKNPHFVFHWENRFPDSAEPESLYCGRIYLGKLIKDPRDHRRTVFRFQSSGTLIDGYSISAIKEEAERLARDWLNGLEVFDADS